ncbi:uncharacterized protein RSE6_09798 [Rhynchosporium secalis]|uniref:Uncharacterized protein n=1 Tax=Rhynchosporium secalis TaxID=38038 RepID=A0A1E1MIX5_RHYSE|nr:uncharacterized protein RSE6_09798 [Rhynchosporium secalis]
MFSTSTHEEDFPRMNSIVICCRQPDFGLFSIRTHFTHPLPIPDLRAGTITTQLLETPLQTVGGRGFQSTVVRIWKGVNLGRRAFERHPEEFERGYRLGLVVL